MASIPVRPLLCLSLLSAALCLSARPGIAADEPPATRVYKTIGERQLHVDIDYPPGWKTSDKRPAIVFFSGGGFKNGTTNQFTTQAAYFAKRGLVSVRAEYRDSTRDKAKADTCLKDAFSAMRWVRAHAGELGIDPDRIVSSGGSAGGYLAAAVGTVTDFNDPTDDLSVSPKPNAMVLFNPVLDFVVLRDREAETTESAGVSRKQISPIYHLTADTPPTLIMLGSKDKFFDQVDRFAKRAGELKVRCEREVYEGQPHAFFNRSPYHEQTAERADRFLQSIGYLQAEPKVELPRPRK